MALLYTDAALIFATVYFSVGVLISFLRNLCVPLRLCGLLLFGAIYRRGAEERRDYAEKILKIRHGLCETLMTGLHSRFHKFCDAVDEHLYGEHHEQHSHQSLDCN